MDPQQLKTLNNEEQLISMIQLFKYVAISTLKGKLKHW